MSMFIVPPPTSADRETSGGLFGERLSAEAASRRALLQSAVLIPGALLLSGRWSLAEGKTLKHDMNHPQYQSLTAWVRIAPDNSITLVASQSEMGQGITTTLASALADELGISLKLVSIEFAGYDPAYRDPLYNFMFTGNSQGISSFYEMMRKMGAAAREMLVSAAATHWKVSADSVLCDAGQLTHPPSGQSMLLGQAATAAARLPVPAHPALRPLSPSPPRSVPRWDVPPKTTGAAIFGIDVRVRNMVIAAIRCAPRRGAKLRSYNRSAILDEPGVIDAVELRDGIAVVASTYWQARRAFDKAGLIWSVEGSHLSSNGGLPNEYQIRMTEGPFFTHALQGDIAKVAAPVVLQETYEIPFQAHATMEPMNCTALVLSDRCELWVPTQGVEMCQNAVAQFTGLPLNRITVHRTLLGGGFGRRLLADFVLQAVFVSKVLGRPVKLIWSREEDMTHDFYRPGMLHRIAGSIDEQGNVASLSHRVVSPSHMLYIFPRGMFPGLKDWTQPAAPPEKIDTMAVEGLLEIPYAIPVQLVEQHRLELDIPVSVWRTTGHGANNFVLESFIDELAFRAKKDPLRFRQGLLKKNARALRILEELDSRCDWGSALDSKRFRGVALAVGFGSLTAAVAEVSVDQGQIHVWRIVVVVDCGRTLDPGIATSNILGGIVWGLSSLQTSVSFVDGIPEQENFDGFTPLSLAQTPLCEVHFVESGESLGGTGELGAVPIPAAVCNAVFASTGLRVRALPLSRNGLTLS